MAQEWRADARAGYDEETPGSRARSRSDADEPFTTSSVDAGVARPVHVFALLPLRVFLAITFIYAGLDKLTDSSFLAASGPGSIGDMMRSAQGSAAIPGLVDMALKSPVGIGYAVAFGELAVGLGMLFGLLSRVAAVGGALISLSLWLTVSWSATPYYYGNDLVYLMAWLPLVIAGAPVFSLDALIRRARQRRGDVSALPYEP